MDTNLEDSEEAEKAARYAACLAEGRTEATQRQQAAKPISRSMSLQRAQTLSSRIDELHHHDVGE